LHSSASCLENSQTRVTARCAAKQDRDLCAVPGIVALKNSWTPNTLIKQGAKLRESWKDVEEGRLRRCDCGYSRRRGLNPNRLDAHLYWLTRCCGTKSALRADKSLQIDEFLEQLENKLTSSGSVYGSV